MRKNIAKLTISAAMAVGLMVMPGTTAAPNASKRTRPKSTRRLPRPTGYARKHRKPRLPSMKPTPRRCATATTRWRTNGRLW